MKESKQLKLVKQLTELFIEHYQDDDRFCKEFTEILVAEQKELDYEENKTYTEWHQKKWPNLDW